MPGEVSCHITTDGTQADKSNTMGMHVRYSYLWRVVVRFEELCAYSP